MTRNKILLLTTGLAMVSSTWVSGTTFTRTISSLPLQYINEQRDTTGWEIPKKQTPQTQQDTERKKENKQEIKAKDIPYLRGAVPEINGKVIFRHEYLFPDKSAQEIYTKTYKFLDKLTTSENQWKESAIVLVNKSKGIIVGRFKEWMVFSKSALALDRTVFNYTVIATCTDGKLTLSVERINYQYELNRPSGFSVSAEEWITDKYALNKKQTKLNRITGKFRRGTVNRVNQLFIEVGKLFTF